ncbi:MipA/OmpV family protein [Sphingomonas nostoxanthinifaciens]|uniref:MipA/OmpV family protein n=1 Tax=Sphingomonas nostoxanthinifaciens TaxID=2872652 RepID=UPI001CC1EB2D|nr:MipA/OmpV family protein [Sphingomonas nostoxanthinifaciens]UAK25535.1 MipA/OmpV family protein [Sphingomonas nostoxanthinifaciens]
MEEQTEADVLICEDCPAVPTISRRRLNGLPALLAISFLVAGLPSCAWAQDASTAGGHADVAAQAGSDAPQGPMNFIAVGVGVAPKYPGAKSYSPVPFIAADITGKGVEISMRGPNIRANLLGDSAFSIGPVAGLNFGRSQSDGGVARNLPKISDEIDLGGYAAYRFGGNERGQGQLELEVTALRDVSHTSNGFTVNGDVSYILLRSFRWSLGADANLTYASSRTLRTYFGITPASALASGLIPYSPTGGVRDVGGGLTAGYQFNRRWGVISRFGYNYLVGDAAKSPIVKAGSRGQLLGGVALSYRF